MRLRAAGSALLVLAAACGSAPASDASVRTFTVLVDGHTAESPLAFSAFFPRVVRVHPGDTVAFQEEYSGLPHTVALGRGVDAALKRIDTLAKDDPSALTGGPPAEFAALPRLLPTGGDANQAAAQPCVVAGKATIPTGAACPDQSLSAYDGSQQLVSSGWLGPDATWSLRFAASTKPGTYRFLCQVHGPDMAGAVQVVSRTTGVKSPVAVAAEAATAQQALAQRVQPGFSLLSAATAAQALAGSGDPAAPNALITSFAPRALKVAVGGAISWTVIGTHSIAFNPPPDATGLRRKDGSGIHLNAKAIAPAGGPGAGPTVTAPPSVIDGGRWDGRGFRSSGIIFGPPPPHTASYRLTFSRAGRYTFVCTIHPAMTGTVTVG